MAQYDNEMRGVLFRNTNRTNDRAPQAKGECQINGVRYWLSAWTSTKSDGEKYQQLRIERAKDEHQPRQRQQGGAAPTPEPAAEDFGMTPDTDPNDIPFAWEGPVEFHDLKVHASRW